MIDVCFCRIRMTVLVFAGLYGLAPVAGRSEVDVQAPAIDQPAAVTAAPRIDQIQVFPRDLRPERGEQTVISFRVDRPASGVVRLFGRDDLLVRELRFEDHGDTAPKRVLWDGNDWNSNPVPGEAYALTIEARDESGRSARYDPTESSGGELVLARDVRYDPKLKEVAYRIDRDARVSVRSGIERGGPLLRVIADWAPRLAGEVHEPWDGLDADGWRSVHELPGHRLSVEAVSLPDHAIILLREDGPSWAEYSRNHGGERPVKEPGRVSMALKLARMRAGVRARFDPAPKFDLSIPAPKGYEQGIPRVRGQVALRIALDAEIKRRITEERYEAVLYVDGQFVTEMEEGYSPATIAWDSSQVADGEHLVTVNLATLSGRRATASLPVLVVNDAAAGSDKPKNPDVGPGEKEPGGSVR